MGNSNAVTAAVDDGGFDLSSARPAAATTTAADDGGFDLSTATPMQAPAETAGRVTGLGARALGEGAADLGSMVTNSLERANPLSGPLQALQAAVPTSTSKEPSLSDFIHPDRWKDAIDYLADKAGFAKPASPGERIASKAVEALPSAALAPEAPVMGAISSAVGGAASQATAETGGGPVAQTLAGLAAGSAPAATSGVAQAGRAMIRDQGDTASRLANAAATDTPLTAGQATGSKLLQRIEGASSKVWGGAPLRNTADAQTESLGDNVSRVVDNLAPGADVSPTGAGEAINKGAATSVANMKAAEKAAYDKVDSLVPPSTPISVSNALAKLDQIAKPTPGAEATTGALVSPKIQALRDNLTADAAAIAGANGGTAALPYDAVKQVRSAVGANIDHGFAPADPATNGAYKQIYKALSDDMEAGASAVSPEAKQAAADASALYKTNSARREFLDTIVDKNGGPEAVYQAATNGTKQGATKIGGVMSELDPGQQNLVRATVIDRLGKALPGQQNAAGDAFNASTFLTNWNKLAPEAKDALFGASVTPKTLRSGLDSLSDTMSTIRNSTLFKNPSGTAEAAAHGYGLLALMGEGGAALMGHPHALAGTAGAIVGNNILARALTNPRTVAWLAQSAKMPTYALPNAVNQLSKIGQANNDPDARDLADYLRKNQ